VVPTASPVGAPFGHTARLRSNFTETLQSGVPYPAHLDTTLNEGSVEDKGSCLSHKWGLRHLVKSGPRSSTPKDSYFGFRYLAEDHRRWVCMTCRTLGFCRRSHRAHVTQSHPHSNGTEQNGTSEETGGHDRKVVNSSPPFWTCDVRSTALLPYSRLCGDIKESDAKNWGGFLESLGQRLVTDYNASRGLAHVSNSLVSRFSRPFSQIISPGFL
jgi:hypothetical protein